MSPGPVRRGVSRRGLLGWAAAGTTLTLLSSCGDGDDSAQEVAFQLGWLPNVESMAVIVADANGYFDDAGVRLKLKPGGPNVVVEPQIVSEKVLVGVQSSDKLAASVAQGADLVAFGAMYQTSPSCILSLADNPIDKPKDLEGKRFGVSQSDARVYDAFFRLTGVDADKVKTVQTAADPAALASGDVDAMSAVLANQPVALEQKGIETKALKLADYGYNRWSGLLVAKKTSLDDDAKRRALVAVFEGVARGLEEASADPAAAAKTVVDRYGKKLGLKLEEQTAGAKVWARLAATENTEKHGLLRITGEGIASQQKFFDAIGIKATAKDLFDTTIGDEVSGERPDG